MQIDVVLNVLGLARFVAPAAVTGPAIRRSLIELAVEQAIEAKGKAAAGGLLRG